MSAGSFTVHGSTARPSARASSSRSRVTLAWFGDHTAHPAARTIFGSDPPWSPGAMPACQGERPVASGLTVSNDPPSAVRQAVAIDGSMRFAATSVRQSNDCRVVREDMPALRTASTTICAKASASSVASPERGVILVSRLKRTGFAALRASSNSAASVGHALAVARDLLRPLPAVARLGVDAADVVALQFGQRQRADRRAALREPGAAVAHQCGVEVRVVREDDDAVARDREVGLERGDADRQRLREGRRACSRARGRGRRGGPAGRRPPQARRASSRAGARRDGLRSSHAS